MKYFALRHDWSISVYTRENHELINLDARIVWASLISSLEVPRYDCLPHRFSQTFQPPLKKLKIKIKKSKIKKESNFNQLVFEPVKIFKTFLFRLLLFHYCPLPGDTRRLFEIFSLIWFGSLCCNYVSCRCLKPTVHDLSNSSQWNTKFV